MLAGERYAQSVLFLLSQVLSDGTLKCWGSNTLTDVDGGQLGLGDAQNRGDGLGNMGDDHPAVDLGP